MKQDDTGIAADYFNPAWLVSRYARPALSVARRLLDDADLAEDAVQETLMRVIRNRDRFRPGESFDTWFFTIHRNICIDMIRRRTRRRRLETDLRKEGIPAGRPADPAAIDLPERLSTLSRNDRMILLLRLVDGIPFREIAASLGIPEETAKKRAQRALARLRTAPR